VEVENLENVWMAQITEKTGTKNRTISVIIVNYNVKDYLLNCITSIQHSEIDSDIEIIVVDNNSFDGSIEMLESKFSHITVIKNSLNLGFAKGVNQGFEKSSGKYILILNPDTIIQEDTLTLLSTYMDSFPKVGMCGPKILNADGTLQLSCKRSFPTPWVALPKILGLSKLFPRNRWMGRYNLTYLDSDQIQRVEAISGSCMFIRREVFEDIGLFDDRFFMFGEDLDFCFRTLQSGREIHYVPLTQIVHYKGESVKVTPFDSRRWFYEAMNLFVDKHFSKTESFFTRWGLRIGILLKQAYAFISSSVVQFIPVLMDFSVVVVAFLIAIPFRFGDYAHLFDSYLVVIAIYSIFWILVGVVFQLYSRFVLSYNRAMLSSLMTFLLIVAFTYFFKQFAYSRAVLLVASALITLGIPGWRLLAHILKSRGFFRTVHAGQSPIFSRPALIVGTGNEGKRIAKNISRRLDTGMYIVGFSDRYYEKIQKDENINEYLPPFLGTLDGIRKIIKSHSIRELVFTSDRLSNESILNVMDSTKDLRLTYRIVPKDRDILLGKASVEDVSDFPFVNIEYTLYHRLNRISKRIFDTIFSALLLVFFIPVFFILLLASSKWKKMNFWGIDGSKFHGWVTSSRNRFLRELPLLICIFNGDMSFVGSSLIPISQDSIQLLCKPGLTGLDRIKKLNIDSDDRAVFEHYYVQHQSMAFDLEILVRTLFTL